MRAIVEATILQFCQEFQDNPYLCYTEHGLHALFFQRLYSAIPPEQRFFTWNSRRVCTIQKEYPTATALGKPKRQSWDVSVIKSPPETLSPKNPYDFFRLLCAVEFGLNEPGEHLAEDIRRLSHPEANVDHGFCVHLYRFSRGVTRRDWGENSPRVLSPGEAQDMAEGSGVKVFYVAGRG